MKCKLTLIATALCLAACEDNSVKPMETAELLKNLENPNVVVIDSRNDSLYNGFKDKNASRGGHIKGAIQFSCDWLDYIDNDKFDSFAAGKGISKEKTLVVYNSNPEKLACVANEFAARGYKVRTFSDYLSYANADYPLEPTLISIIPFPHNG